jgi:hypothetical protein
LLLAAHGSSRAENDVAVEVKIHYVNRVRIADPFIEIHTGPAQGYPIYYVIDRGEVVTILGRQTDWYKIKSDDGKTGWASRAQMQQTLLLSGAKLVIEDQTEGDFAGRQWVLGITGGEFESAPVFTIFTAYSFTENLSAELAFGQSVGNISSSSFWKTNLVMQPLPDLSYSPYLTLGIGKINVNPSATLITPNDGSNTFSQVGVGIQKYVSRSFMLRFELNEYIIFSATNSNDQNEEVSEWKVGFAVFF